MLALCYEMQCYTVKTNVIQYLTLSSEIYVMFKAYNDVKYYVM